MLSRPFTSLIPKRYRRIASQQLNSIQFKLIKFTKMKTLMDLELITWVIICNHNLAAYILNSRPFHRELSFMFKSYPRFNSKPKKKIAPILRWSWLITPTQIQSIITHPRRIRSWTWRPIKPSIRQRCARIGLRSVFADTGTSASLLMATKSLLKNRNQLMPNTNPRFVLLFKKSYSAPMERDASSSMKTDPWKSSKHTAVSTLFNFSLNSS